MARSRFSIALTVAAALSLSLLGAPASASASETAASPCPLTDVIANSELLGCQPQESPEADAPKAPETKSKVDKTKPKGDKGKPKAKKRRTRRCIGAGADPLKTSIRRIARATVCLLNKRRAARGLRRLRLNPRLSRAARSHSLDMVAERYFAHVSKGGRDVVDRIKRTGYLSSVRSWTVGENLAWGSGTLGTPRKIVKAWMHSAGHRHNILTGRFREIGIGIELGTPASGAQNGATYTTTFGARS